MSDIDRSLQQLINDILASDVYREYQRQLSRVKEQPELKAQIDEYRFLNYELQTREDTSFEQIDEFERKYAGFRENSLVSDFLSAELAFCRLFQDINSRMTEAMEFE